GIIAFTWIHLVSLTRKEQVFIIFCTLSEYSSKSVLEHLKHDPVFWGYGLSGALYWRDLIFLVPEVGFSTPYLVTASHIAVHNSELQKKASKMTNEYPPLNDLIIRLMK
uniref:Uncharacterized protein n=1 Tax=Hucho hucho TaxID=62062 RepID=A0A4W5JIX7_9TELE